jgi:hypothetical protein
MLNVYTYESKLALHLSEEILNGSLKKLKQYIVSILGFTSQIHLYHEPLSTFSRLDFVSDSAIVREIVAEFG